MRAIVHAATRDPYQVKIQCLAVLGFTVTPESKPTVTINDVHVANSKSACMCFSKSSVLLFNDDGRVIFPIEPLYM